MTDEVFSLTGPLPEGVVVLEASAGTGKTYAIAALAARYVAEGVPLRDLMLVTFSRTATAELRTRVRERLEQVERALATEDPGDDPVSALICSADPEELADRHARVAAALAEYDQATIATTHEFCGRMLDGLGVLGPAAGYQQFVPDLTALVSETANDAWLTQYGDARWRRGEADLDAAHRIAAVALQHLDVPLGPPDPTPEGAERIRLAEAIRRFALQRKERRGLTTYDDMPGLLLAAMSDPEVGELACRRLAARFPVVLIDEVQDTDPQQWEIIRRAFVGRSTVILIGDPKQAIYAFRGADVRSYLKAVHAASSKKSLGTNYRSDDRLVQALNALLGQASLGHEDIVVHPVDAHESQARLESAQERWAAPVRIRELVPSGPGTPRIDDVRARIEDDIVDDIRGLVGTPATTLLERTEDGQLVRRPVDHGDIAILVQANKRGESLQRTLSRAGIPAVFAGSGSVFGSEAAQDWLVLLRALTEPRADHVRQVGLTAFHGWDFPTLAGASSAELTQLGGRVRGWARTLTDRGVAALVEEVLDGGVAPRVLAWTGGERLLTDLRHVGEALARAEAAGIGTSALADWLAGQVQGADENERMRRVERDGGAVRIMTIHGAKGLQFPIVYLPDVADRYFKDDKSDEMFVLPDGENRFLDVGGSRGSASRRAHYDAHLADQGGEDLRKLYVALTRAQSQVTMWWSPSHNTPASPLQRILFRGGASSPELLYDDADLDSVRLPAGVARQRVTGEATPAPAAPVAADPGDAPDLVLSTFDRAIDFDWRRTSYTGLTVGAHALAPVEMGMKEADEPAETDADALEPDAIETEIAEAPGTPSPLAGMPGGTQFGSLVHAVLEEYDPLARDLPTELLRACTAQAARIPVPQLGPAELAEGLLPVVRTPLGPLADGLMLCEIGTRDRLAELDFELPLGSRERHALLSDLADLIAEHLPADDVLAAYPDALRAEGLGEQTLRGFLTGSIDAVLRVGDEPRHLVVDYKTNRVGPVGADLVLEHYTMPAMAQAMIASHYPLQALLYCVALHRFLRWRLAGYDPATHLGGVLYLFVRGMGGEASVRGDDVLGVFRWSPPPALVVALSDRIGGRA